MCKGTEKVFDLDSEAAFSVLLAGAFVVLIFVGIPVMVDLNDRAPYRKECSSALILGVCATLDGCQWQNSTCVRVEDNDPGFLAVSNLLTIITFSIGLVFGCVYSCVCCMITLAEVYYCCCRSCQPRKEAKKIHPTPLSLVVVVT